MNINTTPGETYIVLSTGGCNARTKEGKLIKTLAAGQDFFTAMTGDTVLSDDNATWTVATASMLSLMNTDSNADASQGTIRFEPVTSQSALPATGENGVIYLVPNGAGAPNQYTEWVWTGAAYEQLGDVGVDLSGYAKINAANTFTTTQKFDVGLETGGISVQNILALGNATLSESKGTLTISNISKVHTLNLDASNGRIERITIVDCIYPSENLDIGSSISILTYNEGSLQTELILGDGVRYRHYSKAVDGSTNTLSFGDSSMLSLELGARLYCGYDEHGICMRRRSGTAVATLDIGPHAQLNVPGVNGDGILLYTDSSGIATLRIGDNAKVIGLTTGGGSGTAGVDTLSLDTLVVEKINSSSSSPGGNSIDFGRSRLTEVRALETVDYGEGGYVRTTQLKSDSGYIYVPEFRGSEQTNWRVRVSGVLELTGSGGLVLKENTGISGPGWDAIVADIQAGVAAAAAEAEQESFTKLIFPPTGTATAEQDPSWITKKNILMETNGGQLNMTHLAETLAYAAQNRFDIAKRTLWLSTSPGSGDAVQWPANAVFPDDQPQDKIQQLNSNSTYWFDITYVGGSDTVLIRKVCSWASTTGENGPTD